MKKLIILVAMFAATTAFADMKDMKILRAQRLFDDMTAVQAMTSSEAKKNFRTREWNRQLPGTSTWMRASFLCIDGDTINTIHPLTVCTEWRVKLKESRFGKDYKSFKYKGGANKFAEDSSNARGNEFCANEVEKMYSHPMVWKRNGCVLWGVKNKKFNNVKTFKSKVQAANYAEDSSSAQGSEFCVEEGVIVNSYRPTYKVEFYAKVGNGSDQFDSEYELGAHTYQINSCNAGALTPVPAN